MSPTNGNRLPGDIGGPVDLNEEYRWNVPTITYGFDQSFRDYFGSNGVAAVEGAIQLLNNLPPASEIVTGNYPTAAQQINFIASQDGVYDLKSAALALIIEQLGLGQPTRSVLALRGWTPDLQYPPPPCTNEVCPALIIISDLVINRNFDPETLAASQTVNGTFYGGILTTNGGVNDIVEFPLDPLATPYTAVADSFSFWYQGLQPGGFYTGLTRDDIGGLRYLLNATNVNWEALPRDVVFTGSQPRKQARGGLRPGVEKVSFTPQPMNKKGKFKTASFKFAALAVIDGQPLQQNVKRVVSQPDILFSVADTGEIDTNSPMFIRTGTTNWVNNAGQNGNATNAGPGVIVPPIKITFDKLGTVISTGDLFNPPVITSRGWASFDASTNAPILYPPSAGQNQLLVRLRFFDTNTVPYNVLSNVRFQLNVPYGGQAALQISTNQTDWISLSTVTNTGSVIHWDFYGAQIPISFRVLPEAF